MKRWRLAHSETMSYLKSKLNSPVATAPWASPCITWFVVLAAGAPTCPWRKPCRCDPGNCSSTNLQRPPTHRSSWHSWSGPYPGMTGIDYETGWNGSIDGLTKKNNISILEMKRGAIGGSFRNVQLCKCVVMFLLDLAGLQKLLTWSYMIKYLNSFAALGWPIA